MDYPLDPFFLNSLRKRDCVLFVGAGLSAAAGMPDWKSLLQAVEKRARQAGVLLEDEGLEVLYRSGDLENVAEHLRERMSPQRFQEAVCAVLREATHGPATVHRLIPELEFRAIVTTNFDHLIEDAHPGGLPAATYTDATRLAELWGNRQPFVWKAHGDIDVPATIVLTRDEFVRLLGEHPALQDLFRTILLSNPILFVGYSHSDPDFDEIIRLHKSRYGEGGPRRYSLMRVVDGEERLRAERLRGVGVQVLPYKDHAEVTPFLQWLLERKREAAAETNAAPPAPQLAPSVRRTPSLRMRSPSAGANGGRRKVVFLPGMMGSELSLRPSATQKARKIWLNVFALLRGQFADLRFRADDAAGRVLATNLLGRAHSELTAALEANFDLRVCPYDWRDDHRRSADQLRYFLSGLGASCDLVAHGEGGLVARTFAARHADLWEEMAASGAGRLILLGTPNQGSFNHLRLLLGEQAMMKLIARVDFRNSQEEIRAVFASFPSVYQTLPSLEANAVWAPLYERASYGRIDVDAEQLAQAAHLWREIAPVVDTARMV